MPGTILGTGGIVAATADKIPALMEFSSWWGKQNIINHLQFVRRAMTKNAV